MGNAPSDGIAAESNGISHATNEWENASHHRSADSEAYPNIIMGVTKKTRGVPVFVMLPLDVVTHKNSVHKPQRTMENLKALKSIGVEGVMIDVWWGIVEKEAPGHYNWTAYRELVEMFRNHGLNVQTVMSFHQCRGNVGDTVK